MEIKRKKMTNAAIYETEQKLADALMTLCHEKRPDFEALGYDLELVFGQKRSEYELRYDAYSADESKNFDAGYISHAVISIKRKKTAEELQAEEEIMLANRTMLEAAETEEEVEQLHNEEELRVADDANKRLAAFTEMMLVRTYKSFWTEWVSLGENTVEIEHDLDEFYAKLLEKTK